MKNKAKASVIASFVADSLALGAHWIYETDQIVKEFGRVDSLLKPLEFSFHFTRDKGEFTHYGDQTLVLLQSIAAKKGFDLEDFSARWRNLFQDYDGYIDNATRVTLENFKDGKNPENSGSPSDDLAGASRIAPLVFMYMDDPETLVRAARAQTKMTHADPLTMDSSEFFARVTQKILQGMSPVTAIENILDEHFKGSKLRDLVAEGLRSDQKDSISTVMKFGQSCTALEALPGVIHFVAKYEGDLKEALIQCVMAGGDSAARGMAIGMILGAHLGPESIPEEWIADLRKYEEITKLLDEIYRFSDK